MTSRITFEGQEYECRSGETVLDALLRQGQNPPFSCRNGSCLVCLQRCVDGVPSPASQRALRPTLVRAGYFLPCKCKPTGDMVLSAPRVADLFSPAVVHGKELLAPDVCRLLIEPATSLYYHAGQFVNLRRADGLMRSYSLASLPSEDCYLEFHIKRMPGGAMSSWIFDELAIGDELELRGPSGRCYYVPGSQEQNLLLVGTGTGAAPLVGIVRDALHVGHRGKIVLVHGSRASSGCYLHSVFMALAQDHKQFTYVPCVSGADVPPGFVHGRAHHIALANKPDLRGWRVFAAGLPQMVSYVEAAALFAGVSPAEIHADPHDLRSVSEAPPSTDVMSSTRMGVPEIAEGSSGNGPRPLKIEPDPEMWKALDDGALLNRILKDFYTHVFQDPILLPYFRGVTQERVVGQVFSFMRDVFTGEKSYFGMRPRTAHHWMVISDEIFDHRERLMEASLRRHHLPEHLIQRWRKFEESFRSDIVKPTPWKLVINGVEMPLDGFGEMDLLAGTMCDGCGRSVDVGERVKYHLRLGSTYCAECSLTESS